MSVTPVINGKIVLKKSKGVSKKYKMVGVLLPYHLISHLALYSLLTKTTRTKIIRTGIQHWYNSQKKTTTTKQLALELAKLYQIEWDEQPSGIFDFSEHVEYIRKDLTRRGVEQCYIDLITSNLKP